MPIYIYWGEDNYALEKAVVQLRDRILDPLWNSFNYTSFTPEQPNAIIEALNQAMTPPFGAGGRLVWLTNTDICQKCPDNVLAELQRTLPVIPESSYLLLTFANKPDERLKSTKLLKQFAQINTFPLISPWDKDALIRAVNQAAAAVEVKITPQSAEMLADAVGNDTRLLYNELEKIRLYAQGSNKPQDVEVIQQLVRNTTQNSLQLATAIRTGDTAKALTLVAELLGASEPSLRIVATLIGQFRTWLWVKMMVESGEKNPQEIAKAAEIGNPKRIYFLQQEIKSLSLTKLISTLPLLLELEVSLKQGAPELPTLQTKVIQLCQVCQRS
ncbi:DNA polymerase III subunit delta [Calothrix sp. UHCC 0171]|uniref:DNA polymerase III subunit delta n=1 Tax=Calothrix sp. UHCC 0171 TaxID=3110245 RepID=UPI002B220440|nr:DNA polymerase III subunit delta [Calothrix sp. UHCC 0171]MEA5570176.1 DNA polymerase III subunit delta [Calothrix sp. UHCC 0171]